MNNKRLRSARIAHGLLAALLGLSLAARAGCSRVVLVPISPIGLSVFVAADNTLQGVYPDILRGMASRDGCSFEFSVVPRARLDALYEAGRADVLIPASRSPRRDEFGLFVPLVNSRAMLISVAGERPPIHSAQELLERKDIKLALVRGFDFGTAYTALVKELTRQGRVVQDVDATSVARLLQAGTADMTIMAPSILIGALQGESKTAGLAEKLRYEAIEELPWSDSGAYISSKSSLSDADRAALRELLERSARSGTVWKAFQRYYPANALTGSIRARS
jgi:polar amino acid transport system substrate-binding protein